MSVQSNDPNFKTDRHTIAQPPPREDDTFKPRLIVVSGVMLGFQLELGSALVVVGRASECGLSLPHPSVSRPTRTPSAPAFFPPATKPCAWGLCERTGRASAGGR